MHFLSRNRFIVSVLAAWVMACLPTREAFACPNCATARVVRASVFDADFWPHLAMLTLPLVVLGLISAVLYRIGIERSGPIQATRNQERIS
jgi:hypothetical protein